MDKKDQVHPNSMAAGNHQVEKEIYKGSTSFEPDSLSRIWLLSIGAFILATMPPKRDTTTNEQNPTLQEQLQTLIQITTATANRLDTLVTHFSDALGAAIKSALSNTGIPKVKVASATPSDEQPEVDVSDEEFLQFDTTAVPVIVSLTKVGRHYIVDATSEEESQMSSAVSVSINRQGLICGLTKRGGAGLDPSVILDMLSVAKHVQKWMWINLHQRKARKRNLTTMMTKRQMLLKLNL